VLCYKILAVVVMPAVFQLSDDDGMFVCYGVSGVCSFVIPNPVLTDAIGPTGLFYVNGISRTELLKL